MFSRLVLGGLGNVPHSAEIASESFEACFGANGTFPRLPSTVSRQHDSGYLTKLVAVPNIPSPHRPFIVPSAHRSHHPSSPSSAVPIIRRPHHPSSPSSVVPIIRRPHHPSSPSSVVPIIIEDWLEEHRADPQLAATGELELRLPASHESFRRTAI
jgi:hypothetical protein